MDIRSARLLFSFFGVVIFSLIVPKMTFAALIEHHGYTRGSESSVIAGGGLEWLRWDKTRGNSFEQALVNYSGGNWRVANFTEMQRLVEAFDDQNNNVHALEFEELFGATDVNGFVGGELRVSKAFYSHSSSTSHAYWASFTTKSLDGKIVDQSYYDGSDDTPPNWDISYRHADWGVALVRGVESVPETASGVLVGIALLGMLFFRRKLKVGL